MHVRANQGPLNWLVHARRGGFGRSDLLCSPRREYLGSRAFSPFNGRAGGRPDRDISLLPPPSQQEAERYRRLSRVRASLQQKDRSLRHGRLKEHRQILERRGDGSYPLDRGQSPETPAIPDLSAVPDTRRTLVKIAFEIIGLFSLRRVPIRERNSPQSRRSIPLRARSSLHRPKRHQTLGQRLRLGDLRHLGRRRIAFERGREHGVRFGKPVGRLVELAKGKRSF